jgi:hypothetical protein
MDASRFVGRAPQQVDSFVQSELEPRLRGAVAMSGDEIRV